MRSPLLTPPLIRAALFVLLAVCHSLQAAPLNISEITAGLDTTSPLLADSKLKLAAARAAYTASRALPNPTLFAEGQTLKNGNGNDNEQTVGVQQSLGFLWSQPSKVAARRLAFEAELAAYEETRRNVIVRIVSTVAHLRSIEQQSALLDTVLLTVERLQDAMNARHREGDVSEYDAKRLSAELIQLQQRRLQLTTEKNKMTVEFVDATGLPASVLIDLVLPHLSVPALESEEEAQRLAIAYRPSLQAKTQMVQASRRAFTAAKLNQWPDFLIGVGRKTAEAKLSGLLWKAELEIPIWGQRRSERNLARAEYERAEIEYQAAVRSVEQEARAAFAMWFFLRKTDAKTQTFNQYDARVNLNRGVQLHASGDFSSAELVDALRSSLDALAAALDLQTARLTTNLELRRATGLPILEP
jgi:outer membrane protein, heavy metal efflux system